MLDGDRERREEGPRTTEWVSGEWRGEYQGGTERKRRWPKAWDGSPKRLPNQRLCGCCVGEVVMKERASGRNRLRGQALGPASVQLAEAFSVIGRCAWALARICRRDQPQPMGNEL